MRTEFEAVEQVVQRYLDGLFDGDVGRLAEAFHPSARLLSLHEGQLREVPCDTWLDAVKARPAPRDSGVPRFKRLVSIDFAGGHTAVAKVECAVPPRRYVDLLTLLRDAQGWRIVSKLFQPS